MVLTVRFFASLAEKAGGSEETVEIDGSSDLHALWRILVERHPALGDLPYRPMVACDLEYASWDTRLGGIREVAFLPPVSGG